MRPVFRTAAVRSALFALLAAATAVVGTGVLAQDGAPEGETDKERAAREALEKAVARGRELWSDKAVFGARKSCATCHDNPDKPNLDLATRTWAYPAYSRKQRRVVTLQQKLNEMIKYQARGKPLELDSADAAALAAYVESLHD